MMILEGICFLLVDNKLIGVPQNFQTTESRGLMIEDVIMIC
jgi:hypothetical protein